ncbi:MAG: type IV pilus twitching motility protein PilT [Candidatus Margulisiibacteriota bacterium]
MDIKTLLNSVMDKGASDLLLVADNPPIMRTAGRLQFFGEQALYSDQIKELVYGLLTKDQQEKFEKEKELDSSFELSGSARFRVNVHYQKGSVAASLRTIPTEVPTVESLHLPEIVKDFVKEPRGLILVTGPTGAGKSTTQAAMIDMINSTKSVHIITVEDPIEFIHKNKKSVIEQREVGLDTNSFPNALHRVLRQDPDVILIGEMRELETISTAITAAETGHLVISTLHTNDAVQTIDRIIDVFPPHQQNQVRMQLSLSLQGVISQQLLQRADGFGQIIATEVLRVNSAVRNIIRKGSTQDIYSIMEIGAKYGMQTMDTALKNLVREGLITKEAALERAVNQENLEKLLAK